MIPVWLEKLDPNTSSWSDSFITQLAIGVPLRPSTPPPRGWWSEIWPLALKVVITGAPISSASSVTASMSKRAPWPTMMTGRLAAASRCTAVASASSGGAIARDAMRPFGPPALAPSGAGNVWTSSGKIRCETPRLSSALLQARLTSSACLDVCSTGCDHWATLPKAAIRSIS